jgi:hypothetical protein
MLVAMAGEGLSISVAMAGEALSPGAAMAGRSSDHGGHHWRFLPWLLIT